MFASPLSPEAAAARVVAGDSLTRGRVLHLSLRREDNTCVHEPRLSGPSQENILLSLTLISRWEFLAAVSRSYRHIKSIPERVSLPP